MEEYKDPEMGGIKQTEDGAEFYLKVMKKEPKPDAPSYTITTIEELFNILTPDNIDRFMKDFRAGMEMSVGIREGAKKMAETLGVPQEEIGDCLKMQAFEWIDD